MQITLHSVLDWLRRRKTDPDSPFQEVWTIDTLYDPNICPRCRRKRIETRPTFPTVAGEPRRVIAQHDFQGCDTGCCFIETKVVDAQGNTCWHVHTSWCPSTHEKILHVVQEEALFHNLEVGEIEEMEPDHQPTHSCRSEEE